MTIRNPIEWVADESKHAGQVIRSASQTTHLTEERSASDLPEIRRINIADIREVLAKGFADLGENRTDVIFLCVLYPVLGLVFARLAAGNNMLPLIFPLASGFALVGPLAGVGLYEMSRMRELGHATGWSTAFRVVYSPSFGSILLLGLVLTAIYVAWLLAAQAIYLVTLGPQAPESVSAFARDVLTTKAGWAMICLGTGIGFVFAVVVLTISVVAFPMLLDRNVSVPTVIHTSIRVVLANPGPMTVWGLVVSIGLVIGSVPLFFGLVIILPVLGHATWHLYRKVVAF